jgi:hypothetical protein
LQEKRIASTVAALEQDTGFRLRVLAQNYPETPGAIHGTPHHNLQQAC